MPQLRWDAKLNTTIPETAKKKAPEDNPIESVTDTSSDVIAVEQELNPIETPAKSRGRPAKKIGP